MRSWGRALQRCSSCPTPRLSRMRGGAMIGQILMRRATGHRRTAAAEKADLGYLFLPRAWGFGYATQACAAALAGSPKRCPANRWRSPLRAPTSARRVSRRLGFTEVLAAGWQAGAS
ncbi:GNAT family N-acetyltransferase [Streptomyces sp. NPDC055955]|uniref:GNAT family N-acetyltransferase n=1 Tax=Streptomyces sp. NPDC055955 TaxID=3345665 RepID=UPI0035D91894